MGIKKMMEQLLERADAKQEAHVERMEPLLGLRSWGEVTKAYPQNLKAGP
jgi:hypothetical protein